MIIQFNTHRGNSTYSNMVKSSILFAFLLGAMFAQLISTHSLNSESKINFDVASSKKAENPRAEESTSETPPWGSEEEEKDVEKDEEKEEEKGEEEIEGKPFIPENRFELTGFDKDFFATTTGQLNGTFDTKQYKLYYNRTARGNTIFTWIKGNNEVEVNISPSGAINQHWRFGEVEITLERSSGRYANQVWDLGNTTYTRRKESRGHWTRIWDHKRKDREALKKYRKMIDEWCAENDFLFTNKKQCVIY